MRETSLSNLRLLYFLALNSLVSNTFRCSLLKIDTGLSKFCLLAVSDFLWMEDTLTSLLVAVFSTFFFFSIDPCKTQLNKTKLTSSVPYFATFIEPFCEWLVLAPVG